MVCLSTVPTITNSPLVMPAHPLTPPLLHVSLVPACHVFISLKVRVLVGTAVNHFDTVILVVKRSSVGLRGCVQSRSACVPREAAESSFIARDVNSNTTPVLGDASPVYCLANRATSGSANLDNKLIATTVYSHVKMVR